MPQHPQRIRDRAVALYSSGLSARRVTKDLQMETKTYVSPQTVARWAREGGVNRPPGAMRRLEFPREAKRLYESGFNIEQIAQRFNVGRTTAGNRLREMGTETRRTRSRFGSMLTADRLQFMYHKRRMRAQEIARSVGCNTGTVYNWLRVRGIPLKRKRRSPTSLTRRHRS